MHPLPDDWFALYGVHWVAPKSGTAIEGECDFVFVGPKIGLIVLEVKGGGIGRDANGWYSIDRTGERHRIKNPAVQAQRGRFAILDYLRGLGHGNLISRLCTTHVVCFPQIKKASLPIPSRTSRRAYHRLRRICQALPTDSWRQVLSSMPPAPRRYFREKTVVSLPTLLCLRLRWQTAGLLTSGSNDSPSTTSRLEQQRALDMFNANRLISLSGTAGSGKTIAALHRAKQVVCCGNKVLILVPTRAA